MGVLLRQADCQRYSNLTYAASIRRKLEEGGWNVTEDVVQGLHTVTATKDGQTHRATAENLTVAFLEAERSIASN